MESAWLTFLVANYVWKCLIISSVDRVDSTQCGDSVETVQCCATSSGQESEPVADSREREGVGEDETEGWKECGAAREGALSASACSSRT